jgi:hypothetical protein
VSVDTTIGARDVTVDKDPSPSHRIDVETTVGDVTVKKGPRSRRPTTKARLAIVSLQHQTRWFASRLAPTASAGRSVSITTC